jgi:hypothetical protein
MIELNQSFIFNKVLPKRLKAKSSRRNNLAIHQRPSVISKLNKNYTFPASIPATKAPERIFNSKNLIIKIPINLIFLRYLSLDMSDGST